VDPKAGGKEENSASGVNLTPVIKRAATQKATYSSSHGGRDSVVAVWSSVRTGLGAHPAFCARGTGALFWGEGGESRWDVVLTTHLRLATRLRMSRVIPLLPTCAAWHSPSSTHTYEEFAPVNTMKAYEGSRGTPPLTLGTWRGSDTAPLILNRHWMEVCGRCHELTALPPGKAYRKSSNKRLGGPWDVWDVLEKTKISSPCQKSKHGPSEVRSVA
jgi:hypothetical protein